MCPTGEDQQNNVDDVHDLLRSFEFGELLQRGDERRDRVEEEGSDQQGLGRPTAATLERHKAQQIRFIADQNEDHRQSLPVRRHVRLLIVRISLALKSTQVNCNFVRVRYKLLCVASGHCCCNDVVFVRSKRQLAHAIYLATKYTRCSVKFISEHSLLSDIFMVTIAKPVNQRL